VATLEATVGCPRPPTEAAWCAQLESAGCTDVRFEDVTEAWRDFVAARGAAYNTNRSRHERVHGTAVYTTMQEFYNATGALFAGGRLGGCVVTARLPSAPFAG
jgi:hypothetical protein